MISSGCELLLIAAHALWPTNEVYFTLSLGAKMRYLGDRREDRATIYNWLCSTSPPLISRDLGPRSRFLGISTMAAAYLAPIHVLAIMVTIERICSIKLI